MFPGVGVTVLSKRDGDHRFSQLLDGSHGWNGREIDAGDNGESARS